MNKSEKHYGLIDLHLHLDGSLCVKTVRELARLQEMEIPQTDETLLELLQVGRDCKNLNEYLEKFTFPCDLLQSREAITLAVCNLLKELKAQGLLYAEIRFAPQLHTQKGLDQMEVVEAAVAGLRGSDMKANLILCCMRGDTNEKQNYETIQAAKAYLGRGVGAVDLAGAEALYPTEGFKELFAAARDLDVPLTIHAGEAMGPESVWSALEFGTRRIGHGVRALEDPALVRKLAEEGITLELCPTSNLNTNIFAEIGEYPLRQLMDAGVKVTINTDNMMVSGVTLRSEMEQVVNVFKLNEEEVRTLLKNAVDACFADENVKYWLRGEMGI